MIGWSIEGVYRSEFGMDGIHEASLGWKRLPDDGQFFDDANRCLLYKKFETGRFGGAMCRIFKK